jgi:hypothetical protein
MRSRLAWISIVLALIVAAPARASTVTLGDGSWCWFGDPRAVRVVGQYDQTFVGWVDWVGHIVVGAYDPRFGVLHSVAIAQLFHDDHSSPGIFVEPDNRLTVFYSGHNGTRMYYRSTLRPEDISAWGPVQTVESRLRGPLGFTYPNPVLLPAEQNKMYLFFRGPDYSQDYATRTIDGRWSPVRRLISAPGQRPYVKVVTNGSDTIAFAFTDGHPRERASSVYYATYHGGSLWTAGGRWIARLKDAPIAPQRGDVVYDGRATRISSWVWDVAFDSHQRPVIVYATFPSVHNHKYWYAHWTGSRWVSHFMTFAGPSISPGTIEQQYSGGMALDHADPSVVFLSRKVHRFYEIEKWTTRDGGYSWSHTLAVPADGTNNMRPIVPRGADGSGPMGLLWLRGNYISYTAYQTFIAFDR